MMSLLSSGVNSLPGSLMDLVHSCVSQSNECNELANKDSHMHFWNTRTILLSWRKIFRCQWNQWSYLRSHHLLSWFFFSIMALHVLFWRWTYDEFVHSTNVTACKCPFSFLPTSPSCCCHCHSATKDLKRLEEVRWHYILQGALESWWHETWRSLTTYGLKHKQEMCIVFDHKGKKISLDITE